MDEYSQLGTTGLVSPLTKSLFGVQKKKRISERDRRESNQRKEKDETEQKEEQDRIMLSHERDRSGDVRRSDDEDTVEDGTARSKHRGRKKVDLVI